MTGVVVHGRPGSSADDVAAAEAGRQKLRDALAAAQAGLDRILEAQTDAAAGLEQAEARIATAETFLADCDELEADVALGEIDPEAVREDRINATRMLETATGAARRHQAALDGITGRIAGAEHALLSAEFQAAVSDSEAAGGEQLEAAAELARLLPEAVAAAEQLARARAAASGCVRQAAALADRLDQPGPLGVDEPAWRPAAWPGLVALLTGGPETPNADAERAARENAEADALRDDNLVHRAAKELALGNPGYLASVPEHLHERIEEAAEEFRETARQALIDEDDRNRRQLAEKGIAPSGIPMADQLAACDARDSRAEEDDRSDDEVADRIAAIRRAAAAAVGMEIGDHRIEQTDPLEMPT